MIFFLPKHHNIFEIKYISLCIKYTHTHTHTCNIEVNTDTDMLIHKNIAKYNTFTIHAPRSKMSYAFKVLPSKIFFKTIDDFCNFQKGLKTWSFSLMISVCLKLFIKSFTWLSLSLVVQVLGDMSPPQIDLSYPLTLRLSPHSFSFTCIFFSWLLSPHNFLFICLLVDYLPISRMKAFRISQRPA